MSIKLALPDTLAEQKKQYEIIARNRRAKAYSNYVRKQRILKAGKRFVGIAMAAGIGFCVAAIPKSVHADISQTETHELQKYVVRYGVAYNCGHTIITDDGNNWYLEDGPDFENGTEVRVLFDSMGTEDLEDDEIIDITER